MSKLSTLFAPVFLLLLANFLLPLSCQKSESAPPVDNPQALLTFQITQAKDGKPVPNATIKLWRETGLNTPSELVETLGITDALGTLEWTYSKDLLPSQHHFSCEADGYDSILISITNPLDKKFTGKMSLSGTTTNPPLSPLTFQITRTKDGKPVPNATIKLWKKTDLYGPIQLVETLGKTDALGMLEWTYSKDSLPSQHHFSCSADGYNGIAFYVNNPLDKTFTGKMSQVAQVTLHVAFTDTVPQKCLCYHRFIHQPNQHAPAGDGQKILLWTDERTELDETISLSIPSSQWSNEIICYKFDPSYQVNSSLFFPNDQNKRSFKFPAPTIDSTFVIDFKW